MEDREMALGCIYEGAWVMHGDKLAQAVDEKEYPADVLERLRGGFFRLREPKILCFLYLMFPKVMNAIKTFERLGGQVLGFQENDNGIIECTVEQLATYLKLPADVVLAFMAKIANPERFFQGTVAFLGEKISTAGKFKITDPVPVGRWMWGLVIDTGCGLLYAKSAKRYFSVETKNDVSFLTEYTGPGIGVRCEMTLGRFISSAEVL